MTPTPGTLQLLLDFEVGGGEAYYNANLRRPTYPGEASGVTIGVGYDLGYTTLAQFAGDWKASLPPDDFVALSACVGKKGPAARDILPSVRTIDVPWASAYAVFVQSTIPRFGAQTVAAFPETPSLPGDCQGALLSLVFNRGASMEGDRRLEMRQIRTALAGGQPERVPGLIEAMVRLWDGTSIEEGMRRRRRAEAALFRTGLSARAGDVVRVGDAVLPTLPALPSVLRLGSTGDAVASLQRVLNGLGFPCGTADGVFGARTDAAVRAFQRIAGLTVDGVVGPVTWKELGGKVSASVARDRSDAEQKRERLAAFAEAEAEKDYVWSAHSDAETRILGPLREPMRQNGDIGTAIVFYNWCAAFVHYCTREVGYSLPLKPANYGSTMALVQSWKAWASAEGVWHPKGSLVPRRGDIVCFEWNDGDAQLDHIGIVRSHTPGGVAIETAEGNVANHSRNMTRQMENCAGFIRLA